MTDITHNRREFLRMAGLASATALVAPNFAFEAAKKRKFEIGATFILWGYGADQLEPALKDIAALGYHSFETFGNVMEEWETKRGGFAPLVQKYGVPIVSAFCGGDVIDPSKRKQELANLVRWSKLLKANGGKVIEYMAGGPRGRSFDYKAHKQNMIESMNEYAKAITDEGLVCALHPHTGTPIETQEEVYFAMENVNTKYMKFGPDVGQLEKGGCDTVKIVKDFMPVIEHVHLKDFVGGDRNGYLGYSALGEGKVKLEEILDMLEKKRKTMAGAILFELDSDRAPAPHTTLEAATISRDFLAKLDYKFDKKVG